MYITPFKSTFRRVEKLRQLLKMILRIRNQCHTNRLIHLYVHISQLVYSQMTTLWGQTCSGFTHSREKVQQQFNLLCTLARHALPGVWFSCKNSKIG